jgi:high-affinity nickel-transport protein
LGHSTIVGLATAALVWSAPGVQARLSHFAAWGGDVGTLISAGFLFAIALANGVVWRDSWRAWRAGTLVPSGVAVRGGFLARLFSPLFQLIRRSWHIYPVGFLFGLGFDTATEIGLLGLSVTQVSHGVAPWRIMMLPALFTAGMALVDSADCILMVGAYGWAFFDPARKLLYNLVMTAVSVGVALLIGGVETIGLLTEHGALRGGVWQAIDGLNDRFGSLGLAAMGVFALCWVFSALILRYRRRDVPA